MRYKINKLKAELTLADKSFTCDRQNGEVFINLFPHPPPSQPAFTYSKLTTETLEQGANMFKVNNKDTRTTPLLFQTLF